MSDEEERQREKERKRESEVKSEAKGMVFMGRLAAGQREMRGARAR